MYNRVGRHRYLVLAFVAYVLLVPLMTWPLIGQLGHNIPGSLGDAWMHLWTFGWVKEAIQGKHALFYSDALYYPNGVSLVFHNIAWLNIVLWLPLQALLNEGAAYTLVYMAILAFNGCATYLFAREVGLREAAAFVAGLIVAFWPYTLSHHDHPNLIFLGWIPISMLFLRRTLLQGRRRDALWAGVSVALLGIARWQLLVMGGFLIGIYLLYLFKSVPVARSRRRLCLLALTAVVAVLLMAPLLSPILLAQIGAEPSPDLFVEDAYRHTDLSAYFLPSRYHPLWGEAMFPLYENLRVNQFFVPFLGYTTLALAVYGLFRRWPLGRVWFWATLVYLLLTLGADIHFNGRLLLKMPMAYRYLVDQNPLIGIVRQPDRLNAYMSIPVAMLAGHGVSMALEQVRRERVRRVLLGTLVLLVLSEYIVRFETLALAVPPWYLGLSDEPGRFGIVNIPFHPRAGADKANMLYQMTHGKPLVGGHVSRIPEEAFAFIRSIPLLSERGTTGGVPPKWSDITRHLRPLSQANIPYLVINKPFMTPHELEGWLRWLPTTPMYDDDDVIVYRTDIQLGRDFTWKELLLDGTDGMPEIGLVQTIITPTATTQGGWLYVNATWGSGTIVEENYDVCLDVVTTVGPQSHMQCQPVSVELPTSSWQPNDLVHTQYLISPDPYLPSGTHTIAFTLRDRQGNLVSEPRPAATFGFEAIPRDFTKPDPSVSSDVTWGDSMALEGYDLTFRQENEIGLTLYWHALQRTQRSYKIFLHLIDVENGKLIAQADHVPRDWSYPTYWWEEDEFVSDSSQIALGRVPPGKYDLYVGVYDAETSERLPMRSVAKSPAFPNAFLVTRIEH